MKRAVIIISEGFEEVEALTPVDYLRRAGIEVQLVSLEQTEFVTGARGITVKADLLFSQVPKLFDCLIIPGGNPGAKNIAAHRGAVELTRQCVKDGCLVAAICAGPALVLGKAAGVLKGRHFTCYPHMENEAGSGALFQDDRVVLDGNIITSRAAGTAGEFSLAIIKYLLGENAARQTAESLLVLA